MIFILGSGPSLDGFNYGALQGRTVIAVNDAGLLQYPQAGTLISTDSRWWMSVAKGERALRLFKGRTIICTDLDFMCSASHHDPRIGFKARARKAGLSEVRTILNGVYTGVHAAINLAYHRILDGESAPKIVLLGVDLKSAGERKYTYGGAKTPRTDQQFEKMRAPLESCAAPLGKAGIEVINASADSALTCWPRCAPNEIFIDA